MELLTSMDTIMIMVVIYILYKHHKETPIFSVQKIKYEIRLTKKRETFTYVFYAVLTVYAVVQTVMFITKGSFLKDDLTNIIFVLLTYFAFVSIIPRIYGVTEQGVYAYGLVKVFGKSTPWDQTNEVKIDANGDIFIGDLNGDDKKDISGRINVDQIDEIRSAIRSFKQ